MREKYFIFRGQGWMRGEETPFVAVLRAPEIPQTQS